MSIIFKTKGNGAIAFRHRKCIYLTGFLWWLQKFSKWIHDSGGLLDPSWGVGHSGSRCSASSLAPHSTWTAHHNLAFGHWTNDAHPDQLPSPPKPAVDQHTPPGMSLTHLNGLKVPSGTSVLQTFVTGMKTDVFIPAPTKSASCNTELALISVPLYRNLAKTENKM